jgi:hypothetical protein
MPGSAFVWSFRAKRIYFFLGREGGNALPFVLNASALKQRESDYLA